jgi:hypothetical protein
MAAPRVPYLHANGEDYLADAERFLTEVGVWP